MIKYNNTYIIQGIELKNNQESEMLKFNNTKTLQQEKIDKLKNSDTYEILLDLLYNIYYHLQQCISIDSAKNTFQYQLIIKKIKYLLSTKELVLSALLTNEKKMMDDIIDIIDKANLYEHITDEIILPNTINKEVLKYEEVNDLDSLVDINLNLVNINLLLEIDLIRADIKTIISSFNDNMLKSVANRIKKLFLLFNLEDIFHIFDEEMIESINKLNIYKYSILNLKQLVKYNDDDFNLNKYNKILNDIRSINQDMENILKDQDPKDVCVSFKVTVLDKLKNIFKYNNDLLSGYFEYLDQELANNLLKNINTLKIYEDFTDLKLDFDEFCSINKYLNNTSEYMVI